MEIVRFWCREMGRDVEVTLDGRAIVSCTAFESPTAIACRRQCMDVMYRRPCEPAALFGAPETRASIR
jgi:hypothetical protein